jgi:hypothetical protein
MIITCGERALIVHEMSRGHHAVFPVCGEEETPRVPLLPSDES